MNNDRSQQYDYWLGRNDLKLATPKLFHHFLKTIENNSLILDVGIGNGACYNKDYNINIIKQKNLKIIGIDIDKDYIDMCKQRVISNNLQNYLSVQLIDLFEFKSNVKFDHIIFTESAPLMSQHLITKMINYIDNNLIKSNTKIHFINNLTDKPHLLFHLKSFIKYIPFINVDFGNILNRKFFYDIATITNYKININLIDKEYIDILIDCFGLFGVFINFLLFFFDNLVSREKAKSFFGSRRALKILKNF